MMGKLLAIFNDFMLLGPDLLCYKASKCLWMKLKNFYG